MIAYKVNRVTTDVWFQDLIWEEVTTVTVKAFRALT